MQPLAALIGIIMGSSVALLGGLLLTLVVLLLLPEFQDRLSGEFRPLLYAIAWAALLTGLSVAAFLGQIRARAWRSWALCGLVAAVLVVGRYYWPSS